MTSHLPTVILSTMLVGLALAAEHPDADEMSFRSAVSEALTGVVSRTGESSATELQRQWVRDRKRLRDFVASVANDPDRTVEAERRVGIALDLLRICHDSSDARALAETIDYQPTHLRSVGVRQGYPWQRYPFAATLSKMGVTGLEECIRLLATTDDPTKVWLARILVWNISGTMVPMEGDIPTAGDDETALALLRIHAHRESQPERKQRIERSVAFFEARIQAGAQREYPKMEE